MIMTREDIENAGRIEREKIIKELQDGYNKHHDINLYTVASSTIGQYALPLFVAGANWRINSVWNNTSKEPTEREMLVVIDKDGDITQNDFMIDEFIGCDKWVDYVKDVGIIKWCYRKDLIPIAEE